MRDNENELEEMMKYIKAMILFVIIAFCLLFGCLGLILGLLV
jgi:hypothetical protein